MTNLQKIRRLTQAVGEATGSQPADLTEAVQTALDIAHTRTDDMIAGVALGNYENDRLTTVRQRAFSHYADIQSVHLPNATELGEAAFEYSGVQWAVLENATWLSFYTFRGCQNLRTVYLGTPCMIEEYAFADCSNLTTLVLDGEEVFYMFEKNILENTPLSKGEGHIYVPENLINKYIAVLPWGVYASRFTPLSEWEGNL